MERMRIINYFESDNKDHWMNEIRKADWGAAEFLYELLSQGTFWSSLYGATDG